MDPFTIGLLTFLGANGMVGLGYKIYKRRKRRNEVLSDIHSVLVHNPSPEEISQNPFED